MFFLLKFIKKITLPNIAKKEKYFQDLFANAKFTVFSIEIKFKSISKLKKYITKTIKGARMCEKKVFASQTLHNFPDSIMILFFNLDICLFPEVFFIDIHFPYC